MPLLLQHLAESETVSFVARLVDCFQVAVAIVDVLLRQHQLLVEQLQLAADLAQNFHFLIDFVETEFLEIVTVVCWAADAMMAATLRARTCLLRQLLFRIANVVLLPNQLCLAAHLAMAES